MKAVRVHTPGGPEAMVYEDVPDAVAAPGQALIKVEAVGVNFTEIYNRRGRGTFPTILGAEAAGEVVALGPDASGVKVGDKVAFTAGNTYAELVAVPAARLVPVPGNLSTKTAAASLLQGMTAHYLACSTYPLASGDTCLVHAAAGGVGLLLCQIAKRRGARVIGTVSSDEKAKAARAAGADEIVMYTQVDFAPEVKRLTDGKGVNVIYDAVGKTTFLAGFDCLQPRGMMVQYGLSSGEVEPVDTGMLAAKGCLFLTRTNLGTYTTTREERLARANDVFGWAASGELKVHVHSEYPLAEASKAQAALENRETIGKVLLIP